MDGGPGLGGPSKDALWGRDRGRTEQAEPHGAGLKVKRHLPWITETARRRALYLSVLVTYFIFIKGTYVMILEFQVGQLAGPALEVTLGGHCRPLKSWASPPGSQLLALDADFLP